MASVTRRPNGHRWVTFKAPNGKRQTLRLGAATEQQALNVKRKVESLLVSRKIGEPLESKIQEWIAELADNLHATLAKCGLVNARGARTVGGLTAWWVKRYEKHCEAGRRATSTLKNVKRVADTMNRYFGKDRNLRTFRSYLDHSDDEETEGEKYRAWLLRSGRVDTGPLAPTTASTMCCRTRYIFQKAVDRGWMKNNPLAEERNWVTTNPDRDEYIQRHVFEAVMKEADSETRLFYSLVRYAGLRGQSELDLLEWAWIDWASKTLFVKAPKTQHIEGHESRFVPLSKELYAQLLLASEDAPEGAIYIFGESKITDTAWNNRLEAACRRAKVIMWPKPKINMRASCEFDWLRIHPLDTVASWMGHSPETMLKHYSRVAKQQSAEAAGSALHAPKGTSTRAS